MEFLEDVGGRREAVEGLLEARAPRLFGQVVADRHAAAFVGQFRKARGFDHELALLFSEVGEGLPVADRLTADLQAGDESVRRQGTSVEDPGTRDQVGQHGCRFPAQLLAPEGLEHRMVKQGQPHLLFEIGFERRGDAHGVLLGEVGDGLGFGDVFQIEEFEKAVHRVDVLPIPLVFDEQALFVKADITRVEAVDGKTALAQAAGQPLHLLAIRLGLVRDHQGDDRIFDPGGSGDGRVEAVDQAFGAAYQIVAQFGVEFGDLGGEAHAAGHGVEFDYAEAGVGEQQVGPHNQGKLGFEAVHAAEFDDLLGLAPVEVLVHPGGLDSLDALVVEEVGGVVEGVQDLPQFLQILELLGGDPERLGGDAPGQAAVGVEVRAIALEEPAHRRAGVELQTDFPGVGCGEGQGHGRFPGLWRRKKSSVQWNAGQSFEAVANSSIRCAGRCPGFGWGPEERAQSIEYINKRLYIQYSV